MMYLNVNSASRATVMTSEEKGFVGFYKISGISHLNRVKVLFGGEIYIREGRIGEKRGRQMEIENRKGGRQGRRWILVCVWRLMIFSGSMLRKMQGGFHLACIGLFKFLAIDPWLCSTCSLNNVGFLLSFPSKPLIQGYIGLRLQPHPLLFLS